MRWGASVIAVVAALAASGCGDEPTPVVVAASSLRPVLEGAGPAARISFSASSTVASQVRRKAPVDLVVVADPAIAAGLEREGLVEAPRAIATNRLAVLIPPGRATGIRSLEDLGREGRRLAVANDGAPLGVATRRALTRVGREDLLRYVVSYEPDAASVLGRVSRGEVDAGIGFTSDLTSGRVEGFALPDEAQVLTRYDVAIVAGSGRRAAAVAYRDWLVGPGGQRALKAAGFGAP